MADAKDQQPLIEEDGYAQLKSRVDELEKELHRKSTETDKALVQLRTKLGTKSRFKMRARTDDSILRPLNNTTTHETVFLPPTLGDFLALTVQFLCANPPSLPISNFDLEREVERLLRELGQKPNGIAAQDLAALVVHIGIPSAVVRPLYE
ncbi:hypothetical protein FHL15_006381 [Xylaria flabelliformis]|uniref:Uncharacterized protein n=1 Tax=Xylaria flabelliformis TaxID=2512241 RepID=A0A553HXN9_9PEZI|nr:hypothetical protein FHL15_006381 [Xylaria flabelliformis]